MTRVILSTIALVLATLTTAFGQLRLVSPRGGEKYASYDTMKIVWTGVPAQQNIKIELLANDNKDTFALVNSVSGLSYNWFLDGYIRGEFLVRITAIGSDPLQADVSDGLVEVTNPELQLKTVKFGEVALGEYKDTTVAIAQNVGTTHVNIQELVLSGRDEDSFTLLGPVAPIRIEGGAPVMVSVRFRPTTVGEKSVKARMQVATNQEIYGTLSGICPDGISKLHLTYPNGNEAVGIRDTVTFRWENNPPGNAVKLEYSRDLGSTWSTIAENITGDSYQWVVPIVSGFDCLARVSGQGPLPVVGDTSDARWHIEAPKPYMFDHTDLPQTTVGSSTTIHSQVFIQNLSIAPLTVESFTISGEHAGEYEIVSGDAPFELGQGKAREVGLKFSPKGVGLRVAEVTATCRDVGSVHTELRGIGISETSDVPETGERPVLAAESTSLQMQPNPAQSDALIQYRLDDATRVRLRIYNSVGEAVETLVEGEEGAGQHLVHIDVGGLASGIYIVVLETESGRQTRTVVVER